MLIGALASNYRSVSCTVLIASLAIVSAQAFTSVIAITLTQSVIDRPDLYSS